MGHAGEYETPMMLHILPGDVKMEKALREIGQLKMKYFNSDYPDPSAFGWQDYWSRFSQNGICGDATAATAESGRILFEATVSRFLDMIREFRTIPIRECVDHPIFRD